MYRHSLKSLLILVVAISLCMPGVARWLRYARGAPPNVVFLIYGHTDYDGYLVTTMFDESTETPLLISIEKSAKKPNPSICSIRDARKNFNMHIDGQWVEPGSDLVVFFSESGEPTGKVVMNHEDCKFATDENSSVKDFWNLVISKAQE